MYHINMRLLVLSLSVAVSAVASASFDLMLVGDNTSAGTNGARLMRYDPQTGAQLGYFGQGFLTGYVGGITVDRASGRAFVQNSSYITVFNYNTGAYIGRASQTYGLASIAYNASTDRLTTGYGRGNGFSITPLFNGDLTLLGNLAGRYTSTAPLIKPGTSTYFSWDIASGPQDVRAAAQNTAFSITSTVNVGHVIFSSNQDSGSYASAFYGDYFYGMAYLGTTFSLLRVSTNATGFTGTVANIANIPSATLGNADMAAGHGDLIYMRTGNTIHMYSASTNTFMGQQTLPGIAAANVSGMALIIAPEPGTWAALGLGAIALMRRRRK